MLPIILFVFVIVDAQQTSPPDILTAGAANQTALLNYKLWVESQFSSLWTTVNNLQTQSTPPCPNGQVCIMIQPSSTNVSTAAGGIATFTTIVSTTGCRTIVHAGGVNTYGPLQITNTWTYTTPNPVTQNGIIYKFEFYGCGNGVLGDVTSNPASVTVNP